MSTKPAELAGVQSRKGSLTPGLDADFVIFNPDAEFTVTPDILHFRHPVTPYLGQQLKGRVEQTFLRGECVYSHGEFPGTPIGRECKV
jgi:allantoinase